MIKNLNAKDALKVFASTISSQPLGLVYHRPEVWAQAGYCYGNVRKKVQRDGGRPIYGWMFHDKIMKNTPELGYLMATHHAVWHSPSEEVIDVTPFHDNPNSHPYAPGGSVLFLVDDNAEPLIIGNMIAPLPLRFFPLSDDIRLITYLDRLKKEEEQRCLDIYEGKLDRTQYLLTEF